MLFALLKPLCSLSLFLLLALLSSIYYYFIIIRPKNSDRYLKALKRKRKKERQRESKNDRLSELPDHLLLHIMQFMIPKQCVQTCVLSKRWKNLWEYLTNIKFHHFDKYNCDNFEKFVSQFLSNRGNDDSIPPLDSISYVNGSMVRSSRGYYRDFPPKNYNIPAKIIEYATSHNVQQVEINDTARITCKLLELLPSIFNCGSLTSLTLCMSSSGNTTIIMFPKSLNLPALETLRLKHFTFFTSSDNSYAEPFSTCNMLSKLAILGCNLQDDAQGLCISNSRLSNLAIGTLDPPSNIHEVILGTPKLTSLTIDGIPPIFPAPSTCNLTLLEELKFDCRYGSTVGEDILISWLHLLAEVKIITLNYRILQSMVNVLKKNGSMSAQLPSFVMKSLKVESHPWICHEIIKEMVTYLLQNSPPPDTFVIGKETSESRMFIGSYIK